MIQVINSVPYQQIDPVSFLNSQKNIINGLQINIDTAQAQINALNKIISDCKSQQASMNQDIATVQQLQDAAVAAASVGPAT